MGRGREREGTGKERERTKIRVRDWEGERQQFTDRLWVYAILRVLVIENYKNIKIYNTTCQFLNENSSWRYVLTITKRKDAKITENKSY